ncbi:hypothetical protein BH20ACT8_BH20ACT8_20010 [soil metagenome]
MTRAYVEPGTGMHVDDATVAWTFDLERWGECGLGSDEATALAALGDPDAQAERIHGDEQAFVRDRQPASDAELDATMAILAKTRAATLALLAGLPDAVLDWDDPDRILPSWARWRTLRQLAWHERGELAVMRGLAVRAQSTMRC